MSLCLSWISPLIALGSRKTLDDNDLYSPLPYEKTEYLADQIELYVFIDTILL